MNSSENPFSITRIKFCVSTSAQKHFIVHVVSRIVEGKMLLE